MNAHGISLDNLTLGYSRRVLLDSACVDFAAGELCALIGRNGTGKSTLLRAMCGLESAVSGSVRIAGLDVSDMTPRDLATRVAFVSTQRVRVANLRVRDVVALGRAPYTGWLGRLSTEDNRAVKEALAAVAMESFADKEMDTLSDGESQRVMIARAFRIPP